MARRTFDRSTSGEGNVIDMKTGKPVERPTLPVICERIRYYRELVGMEQKELARRIGVTGNSVSNWENGRARPDINLLPEICRVLDVTLYELFDMDDPTITLTAGEQMHIDSYRQLTKGHRFAVDRLTDDLISVQIAESCPDISQLQFFEKSLAAGIGDPTEFEEESIPIFVYTDRINVRANCVFTVNGDSMEPAYHNGDMVLVERIPDGPDLDEGETGAFIVGNETYIKNFYEDGLHSLNPKYPVMTFQGEEAVYLIGRVLGILDPSAIAAETDVEKYMAIHPEES